MECLVKTGRDAANSTALQEMQADLARYHYESKLVEQASQALLNHHGLSHEHHRVLNDWLEYAGYMMNPQTADTDCQPF